MDFTCWSPGGDGAPAERPRFPNKKHLLPLMRCSPRGRSHSQTRASARTHRGLFARRSDIPRTRLSAAWGGGQFPGQLRPRRPVDYLCFDDPCGLGGAGAADGARALFAAVTHEKTPPSDLNEGRRGSAYTSCLWPSGHPPPPPTPPQSNPRPEKKGSSLPLGKVKGRESFTRHANRKAWA